jgi:hypothetical protein
MDKSITVISITNQIIPNLYKNKIPYSLRKLFRTFAPANVLTEVDTIHRTAKCGCVSITLLFITVCTPVVYLNGYTYLSQGISNGTGAPFFFCLFANLSRILLLRLLFNS